MSTRLSVERDLMVPMADGTHLATDIYRGGGDGPWPVLVQRVAYNKERSAIANGALEIRRAVDRGYAVCVQDVRGRYRSGGDFTPFVNEGGDGADTVAWLGAQTWSEGPICMFGRSYSGALQWAAADQLAERGQLDLLGALSPCMAGWDVPGRWLVRDGVFQLGFVAWWAAAHLAPADLGRRDGSSADPLVLARHIDHLYWTLDSGAGPSVPYLEEWLALGRAAQAGLAGPAAQAGLAGPAAQAGHPGLGGHDPADSLGVPAAAAQARAAVPALHIAGWYDVFLRDTLAGFTELAAIRPDHHRLVVGPWAHGGAMGGNFAERSYGLAAGADAIDLTNLQLDWFDQWLGRAAANAAAPMAPVHSFVTGIDHWVELDGWPPAHDSTMTLFPVPTAPHDQSPLATAPAAERSSWSFVYDPGQPTPTVGGNTFLPGLEVAANAGPRDQRPLLARPDGMSFFSAVRHEPLEVVGSMYFDIDVEVAPTSSMLVVTVADVFDNGRAEIIAQGARQFDRSPRSIEAAPQIVGDRVTLEIGPLHHVVRVGHRICVHVAAGSYPAYDRLAATGGAEVPIEVVLSSPPSRPSALHLPVVTGRPGTPPPS